MKADRSSHPAPPADATLCSDATDVAGTGAGAGGAFRVGRDVVWRAGHGERGLSHVGQGGALDVALLRLTALGATGVTYLGVQVYLCAISSKWNCIYALFLASVTVFMRHF